MQVAQAPRSWPTPSSPPPHSLPHLYYCPEHLRRHPPLRVLQHRLFLGVLPAVLLISELEDTAPTHAHER